MLEKSRPAIAHYLAGRREISQELWQRIAELGAAHGYKSGVTPVTSGYKGVTAKPPKNDGPPKLEGCNTKNDSRHKKEPEDVTGPHVTTTTNSNIKLGGKGVTEQVEPRVLSGSSSSGTALLVLTVS